MVAAIARITMRRSAIIWKPAFKREVKSILAIGCRYDHWKVVSISSIGSLNFVCLFVCLLVYSDIS